MSSVPQAPPPLAWRWLLVWSAFFVVFGAATALLGSLPPASLWTDWIADHFVGRPMSPNEAELVAFMRGPLGATMAGSYVMQTALVAIPLRRGERWAWWSILGALLTWFVIDCAVSIAHGAWFNVVRVNLVALVVTGIGLAGTWSMVGRREG